MNRKDRILNIREVLFRRRDKLLRALAGGLEVLGEHSAEISGEMSAPVSLHHDLTSCLNRVQNEELASIERALERMRRGEFGSCEDCGSIIPMARLNALPYANRCLSCQREAERRGLPELASVPTA